MSRKAKRTLSMGVVIVLIAALAGVYFLRPGEAEYEYGNDEPPAFTTEFIVQREEREVAGVRFISEDKDYEMIPYDDGNTIVWQYQPHPDFLLMHTRARDKARPAWHLALVETAHEDSQGLDLAEFGLQPPHLTMEATYTDGTRQNIYIGAQTVDRRHHFAMVSGSPSIYLIGNFAAEWAMADIESLIDRTIQPFEAHAERILIAQRNTPAIELSMSSATEVIDALADLVPITPEGQILRLVQPMEIGVDHSRLTINVLEPLELFRLGDIVSLSPGGLSPYGLDTPSLIFAYQDPFGETHLLFGDTFIEEVNGQEVEFIYVKFADRPHVFRAEFQPVSGLFNLNIFTFIERFIALPSILGVERVTVEAMDESRNLDMVINHGPPGSHDIFPTINGVEVEESDFRVAYRLLIALMMEGEIEPFTPQGTPDITITYHRPEEPNIEIRLFALDSNLYAVSLDGEDAWFVTHRRDADVFFNHVVEIIG